MTIIYRILSFLINLVALLFAVSLIIIIPVSLTFPALWFPAFLIIAIVLYTWFSNKFQQKVLLQRQVVKLSLRDWIRVNGFVAIGFSFLNITPVISLLKDPSAYIKSSKEMMKNIKPGYEDNFKDENVNILGIVMLIYIIALLVHVLWTFALLKKNKDFFQ